MALYFNIRYLKSDFCSNDCVMEKDEIFNQEMSFHMPLMSRYVS